MNKIDKYIGFSFNGLSLGLHADADFKGFIVNEGDLSFGAPTGFENEFADRPYGEGSIYLGRTKTNKIWNMRLMLRDVSLNKYREFLVWLNESVVGFLVFDYNKNYGYKAKVDSIGEGLYYPSPNCRSNEDLYFVEIEVGFVSVNGGLAQWIGKEAFAKFESGSGITGSLIDNEFGVPFLEYEEISESVFNITLTNKHNVPNSFTIELFDDDLDIVATDDGTEELYFYSIGNFPKKFFAEHGVLINSEGKFEIFDAANDIKKIIIPPNSSRKFILTIHGGKAIIRPTSYEIF